MSDLEGHISAWPAQVKSRAAFFLVLALSRVCVRADLWISGDSAFLCFYEAFSAEPSSASIRTSSDNYNSSRGSKKLAKTE